MTGLLSRHQCSVLKIDLFLDDVSTDDVERELGVTLVPVNNNGNDLVEAVIAGKD